MRIAVVDPGAAVPWHDHQLCRTLGGQGHHVVLATSPFIYGELPPPKSYTAVRCFHPFLERAPHIWAKAGPLRQVAKALTYLPGWLRVCRIVQRESIEVVHLHWSVDPVIDGWLVWRLKRVGPRVVCSIHNAERRGREAARRVRWDRLVAEADAVVVYSKAAGRALRARAPEVTSRLHCVPLGPGIEASCKGSPEARQQLGLSEMAPVALFFGLVKPYKGLTDLLHAWALVKDRLPDARLVVAGLPGESPRPHWDLIHRLGIGPSVQMELRYIPHQEASLYLAAADVVVLPYREASQSAVLPTAYACGRPVVATSVAGLAEAVEPGKSGLLARPGDPADLAEKLVDLLSDRRRARRMGSCARKLMEERHAWPLVAESVLEIYRSVLQE